MEKEQRLAAFRELTRACYPIWDWELDGDFQVLSTSCPHKTLYHKLILGEGRREIAQRHRAASTAPLFLTMQTMLSWILVFEENAGPAGRIYIKGPFFSLRNDPSRYDAMLTAAPASERTRKTFQTTLRTLPVLPTQTVYELAQMLHYCVNATTVSPAEVTSFVVQQNRKRGSAEASANPFERSSRLWQIEQEYVDKIRRGDLSVNEALVGPVAQETWPAFSNRTEDLQKYRRGLHTLLTLASRAAVDGGLPKKTSFSLCTKYRQILDGCTSAEEMQVLSGEILNDYARQVHRVRQFSSCSARVKLCCEYIDTHPEEKLMLSTLAEKAGYTQTYLSRKFRQEMGCSITDYIRQSKIQRSKFLLESSEYSVDDISDLLGFGSRSYFSSVFKKLVGQSPTQYRKQHQIV